MLSRSGSRRFLDKYSGKLVAKFLRLRGWMEDEQGTVIVFLITLGALVALVAFVMDLISYNLLQIREKIALTFIFPFDILGFVAFSVFLAFCSACSVKFISPHSAGSGIPEMKSILTGNSMKRYLSFRTLISKCIGLVFAQASLFVGSEGPFIHIASCICARLMKLPYFERIRSDEMLKFQMLGAACAAGVSANFGCPVGGVIFSVEVLATYYLVSNLWKGLACSTVGAVVFFALNSITKEKIVSLLYVEFPRQPYALQELLFFLVLGVAGGLLGALFVGCIHRLALLRRSLEISKNSIFGMTMCVAAIVAFSTYPYFFLRGRSQKELVSFLLSGSPLTDWEQPNVFFNLALFLFLYWFLSIFSVMCPVPCGQFLPAFVIGSVFGRMFGEFASYDLTEYSRSILPGAYACVGAAAMVAGVTRTLSTAVIIFELTGQLSLLLPVLIATVVGCAVGNLINLSVFDTLLMLRGLPYLSPSRFKQLAVGNIAADMMKSADKLNFLTLSTRVEDVVAVLADEKKFHFTYPVVDAAADMRLIGTVHRGDLEELLSEYQSVGREMRELQMVAGGSFRDGNRPLEFDGHHGIQFIVGQVEPYVKVTGEVELMDLASSHSDAGAVAVDGADGGVIGGGPSFVTQAQALAQPQDHRQVEETPQEHLDVMFSDVQSTGQISDLESQRHEGSLLNRDRVVEEEGEEAEGATPADVSLPMLTADRREGGGETLVAEPMMTSVTSAGIQMVPATLDDDLPDAEQRVLSAVPPNPHLALKRTRGAVCAIPIDPAPFVVNERTPIERVAFSFSMLGLSHAFVLSAGRLIGVITKKNLIDQNL